MAKYHYFLASGGASRPHVMPDVETYGAIGHNVVNGFRAVSHGFTDREGNFMIAVALWGETHLYAIYEFTQD